jgi:putative peptidoglycan lipid II flippase
MTIGLVRPRASDGMRRLVALGVPGLVAGGITQINIVVGTIIASLQAGAVSYLYYADRLYQLPLGIVGVAVGVVLLPDLSRHLRNNDRAAAMDSQNRSLEFALLLTLPAAIALAVAAEPIVSVLFERGAFTAADTPATAYALAAFAIGLPAFVLIKVFQPGFFAREDTSTPMRYAAVNMAVNVAGSLALFFALQAMGLMPHVGIALATSLAGWVNALLLWRRLVALDQLEVDARLRRNVPLIALASLAMGLMVATLAPALGPYMAASAPLATRVTALALLVGAGVGVFAALILATGVLRADQLGRFFRRRS